MITQEQMDQGKVDFSNFDITLKSAIEIADSLSEAYNTIEIDSFLDNKLYEQSKSWNEIEQILSFSGTLDRNIFDHIEETLGLNVALQVYRFHLEERSNNNLSPHMLLSEQDLDLKMRQTKLTQEQKGQFRDLNRQAKGR